MSTPFAVRRSALVLHALSSSDQEAVLRSLNVEQQDLLRPLLQELRELGMPADPDLLEQALAETARDGREDEVVAKPDVRFQPCAHQTLLDSLAAEQAAVLLRTQPVELVVRLLASRPWDWAPAALGLLEPRMRQKITDALELQVGRIPAPRLNQAVIRCMADKAVDLRVKSSTLDAPAPQPRARRFMYRISRALAACRRGDAP